MKIGIIGVGHIGSTLARKYVAAGHEVRVANSKGPDGVRALADEIGAVACDSRGAIAGADAIILSIPLPAVTQLPADLFDDTPDDVPIIDTGNYYPGMRDPSIPEIDAGETESMWVARQLGRPVIKAFNNILAESLTDLGRPEGAAGRLAIAVAGDDPAAKQIAMDLVNVSGFDPVDSGSLEDSWRQEPYTPVYCLDHDAATTRETLPLAVRGTARAKIAQAQILMADFDGPQTHAGVIKLNRRLQGMSDE
jgi:predicted dinucleotide-binding enzyme